MDLKFTLSDTLKYSVFFITLFSIHTQMDFVLGNTTIWMFVQMIFMGLFVYTLRYYFPLELKSELFVLKLYLLWMVFNIIRGVFVAEVYWDYKALIFNSLSLLVPLLTYHFIDLNLLRQFLRSYVKYILPLFVVFVFLLDKDAYGFYLVPLSLLLLFFSQLNLKWRIFLVIVSLFVVLSDITARSNAIKFSFPLFFSLIYFFRKVIPIFLVRFVRKFIFISPFLFLVLAVTNIFNVFLMKDYMSGDISKEDAMVDTRTFIYVEVLTTAAKYNTWLFGRSPARGNETEWFKDEDPAGRGERYKNEVGMLNVFTWTGLVGVLLYSLLFYKASYLAVCQSKNFMSKILGLYIAFRFVYSWVEDINEFNLNYMVLWMLFALCFSKGFREMSDLEVKFWVRGIVDKKYALALHKVNSEN